MSDVQNIAITSAQTVPQPKPHTTYTVQVTTPIRSWTVDRRYNDFVALHAELMSSTNKIPPAALPPKHPWSLTRSAYDEKIVRERRVLLETYLRAILTNKSPVWRESYTFLDFLAVPQNTSSQRRNGPGAGGSGGDIHWTPANWLTEHAKVETALRATRSELLKRDALAGMGDAAGSRGASVSAKKMIRAIGESIDQLSRGLDGIAKAVGDGEKQRREDLVEGLRNERANLSRMAEAGVRTNREATGGSAAGSNLSMPGGNTSIWGDGAAAGGQVQTGRVFGKKPEETDETRPLDDRGVLQLQQTKMDGQDQQLRELSAILQRQRGMGEEIHREIGEQTEILEEIEHSVDRTGGKMARAKRQMNRLN